MSALLDSDPTSAALVEKDLELARRQRGSKWSAGGLTGRQVLALLLLKQFHGFSYREMAFHLMDSRTYRTFCQLGWNDPAPSKSALAAALKALRPRPWSRSTGGWSCWPPRRAWNTAARCAWTRRWSSR